MKKASLCALLTTSLLVAPAGGTSSTSAAEAMLHRLEMSIAAQGHDRDLVLATDLTLPWPPGSGTHVTQSVEGWVHTLAGDARLSSDDPGIGGTPEILAGDLYHVYVDVAEVGAIMGYAVSTSSGPETPYVAPPPPLSNYAFVQQGPLRTVSSTPYDIGFHTVGTYRGTNVSTAARSGVVPVWIPVAEGNLSPDNRIEFLGNAEVFQTGYCSPSFCVSIGWMIASGLAMFGEDIPPFPAIP